MVRTMHSTPYPHIRAPRFRCPPWTILALLVALAPTWAAGASEPFEAPRFFIEAIDVEGAERVSPAIIVSESLLELDRDYDEPALRDAIYRVNRLPFILDAQLALERGSERGRYRLVITVREVERFFFGADFEATLFTREVSLEDPFPIDATVRRDGLVGARFFMGTYGVFFAAVTGDSVQLGLTRYQLFGRRVFASLGLVRQSCCPVTVRPLGLDPTFSRWLAVDDSTRGTITLAMPLRGNHSLRFDAWRFQSIDDDLGTRVRVADRADFGDFDTHEDIIEQSIELGWIYDSSDDPTFPTRGSSVSLTLEIRELRADFLSSQNPSRFSPLVMRSQMRRLIASGSHHWSPTPRQSFSATLRLAGGFSDVENVPLGQDRVLTGEDLDLWEGGLTLRHTFDVWQRRNHSDWELRWENEIDLGYESTSPTFGQAFNPLHRWRIGSSLVFRSTWGIFRAGFSFVEVDQG